MCGHVMAAFNAHDKCVHCREKWLGKDPDVLGESCEICDDFSDTKTESLYTLSYKLRKKKREWKYSQTCEEQPPKGKCKSGCSLQVVALRRFSYLGHELELCVLYPYVLQTKHL